MFEIGRLCVKIAGRDAGRKCVIVDVIDSNFVIIDGDVRRKRCNVKHLEPLEIKFEIAKGASNEEVASVFKKHKISVWSTKARQKTEKPKTVRRSKKMAALQAAQAAEKEKPKKKVKAKKTETIEEKKE